MVFLYDGLVVLVLSVVVKVIAKRCMAMGMHYEIHQEMHYAASWPVWFTVESATKPESETTEEELDPNNNKMGFNVSLNHPIYNTIFGLNEAWFSRCTILKKICEKNIF